MDQMQSYHYNTAPVPIKEKGSISPASHSTSSHPFPFQQRRPLSQSTFIKPQTALTTSRSLGALDHSLDRKSNTWTSSSGELGLLSENEEAENREEFVREYNRLAKRYGIRLLVTRDFPVDASEPTRRPSWFSKALRRTSSGQSTQTILVRSDSRQLRRRRSVSDVALNLVHHIKKDELKGETLRDLVRLCGKTDTRGIFRVPGSARVVGILYDYYCPDRDARGADAISITTRCPNLPSHIKCSAHDIASAFKRFIAGLPGGILGSLSLFDALVAIHSQLHADPELTKTRETKLRARLIALAIGTVRSQYQRELICAVFGLLCLVGRAAENAPREDENGRPLPTADLMGYNALSIVFGPLLINGLIDSYSMNLADPAAGLVLLPVSAPKSRKERRKHRKSKSRTEDAPSLYTVDKIHVANSITEMLIVHWREVVQQMRSLGVLKISRREHIAQHRTNRTKLGSSASDSLPLRKPPEWNGLVISHKRKGRSVSPLVRSPTPMPMSPAARTLLRDSHESAPKIRSLDRMSGSGESEAGGRTRVRPFRIDVHEDPSVLHNRSSLSHILSGSELTFHSIKSSTIETGDNEGYSSRQDYATPRSKEFEILEKFPSRESITPVRPSLPTEDYHSSQIGDYIHASTQDINYTERWKALSLASKTSTESLARSAKERRLRRSPGNSSLRQSEESFVRRDKQPSTPKWKQQVVDKQSESEFLSERKSIYENSPRPRLPREPATPRKSRISPDKNAFEGMTRPVLYRSSSKPTPGSVKAIAALFDNTIYDSPVSSTTILPRRIGRDSSSVLSPYSASNSPSKCPRSNNIARTSTPSNTFDGSRGGFQLPETPTRSTELGLSIDDGISGAGFAGTNIDKTSAKAPCISLRPIGDLATSRKVPQSSKTSVPARDRELDQPPSLGTMVPPLEEPPIAQHINFSRPYTSSPVSCDRNGDDRLSASSPPPGSGNSMLYTQIRHLQKQLEHRTEENTQLRRQLEARENMDIGKLCEQLRAAKRESKMWRERAEAAERRVAVFKQFTARVRGLRDGTTFEDIEEEIADKGQVDGPSHHVEEKEQCGLWHADDTQGRVGIEERIRQYMKKQVAPGIKDRSLIGTEGLWCGGRSPNQSRRTNGRANRTAQLWDITDELLMLDGTTKREAEQVISK
ncbi:hypothetical protein Daesc_006336 [Daldinia eschscholtzii]|uniref:Rho-GAP domain-containing protein n=1 Tax=Daldinia eschscholtzii TaxID=292717 RepID=A0AAX6MI19_9PEZI